MTTKDIPENHEPAPPLGLGSSEGLGAWVPVADRLPEPGAAVLVACGKFVMRAVHVPHMAFCEATHGYFEPEGAAYYDEGTDETYWPAGWYEWNQHEETHWALDDEPTHWMPLPAPPENAPND
jgi:hypothetical protein